MKYPTIEMKKIPFGFKHCEIAIIIAFEFSGEDRFISGEDQEYKRDYVDFAKREMVVLFESLLTLYRPVILPYKEMYIVALKDNAETYRIKETISKLMGEFKHFTNHVVDAKIHMAQAIILEENKPPTMFKSNRIGEVFEESKAYKDGILEIVERFNQADLSYITPYEEYVIKRWSK